MRVLIPAFVACALLLTGCPQPEVNAPGGKVAGAAIGTDFDGKSFTIGKGDLEGKGVVVVYFASW